MKDLNLPPIVMSVSRFATYNFSQKLKAYLPDDKDLHSRFDEAVFQYDNSFLRVYTLSQYDPRWMHCHQLLLEASQAIAAMLIEINEKIPDAS